MITPTAAIRGAHASALERADARVKLMCLLVYSIAALHARSAVALALCAGTAAVVALAVRLDGRSFAKALRPLAVILVFTVVMQVLYLQQGEVLFQVGPVAVTRNALEASAGMLVGLCCVLVASIAFMRCTPTGQLVMALDWCMGPLRAAGVRTEAFLLALSVAFRFVPVLVDDFSQLKDSQRARHASFEGGVRDRLAAYARLFPPLVRGSFWRADHLADAFLARCFAAGPVRTSLHQACLSYRDAVLAAAALAIVCLTFLV